jgi:hypothetical protein
MILSIWSSSTLLMGWFGGLATEYAYKEWLNGADAVLKLAKR